MSELGQRVGHLCSQLLGYVNGDMPIFSHVRLRNFLVIDCGLSAAVYDETHGSKRERLLAALANAEERVALEVGRRMLAIVPDDLWAEDFNRQDARQRLQRLLAEHEGVPSVDLQSSPESVESALATSETLIAEHGASYGFDRLHTALHAYLEWLCEGAGIEHEPQASLQRLARLVRERHPMLQVATTLPIEPREILDRLALICEVLNHGRNRASGSHPNNLLPDPEARLLVNSTRTILHYLEARRRIFTRSA